MAGETRSAIHDSCHYDYYWFSELCPDEATCQQIMAACPRDALVDVLPVEQILRSEATYIPAH